MLPIASRSPTRSVPAVAVLSILVGLLCVLGTSRSHAQRVAATIDSTASVISYTGSATMHDWTGTSRAASGTLVFDLDTPDSSRALVQVPVASFESGPDLRDKNMRKVTEADQYPMVTFRTTGVRPTRWSRSEDGHAGQWQVTGDLTFHGQTHPIDATVDVRVTDDSAFAHARFPVSLTRFGVERPALLWGAAPVGDTIRIDARLAGAVHEQPSALKRLDTTRNEATDTRRVSSAELRSVPATRYAGTRARLQAAVHVSDDGKPEWSVALYGFTDRATGLADAPTITLRADRRPVQPLRVTGSTRQLDDGTTVEIARMYVSRSTFETIAEALTVSATVGPARFSLSWPARHDLRLILDEVTTSSSQRVSANGEE